MGHASPQAALRYQHATRDRDAAIAIAINEVIARAMDVPFAQALGAKKAQAAP